MKTAWSIVVWLLLFVGAVLCAEYKTHVLVTTTSTNINGAVAESALLGSTFGVCLGLNNEIYFSSSTYNTVWKMDSNGTLHLVAGTGIGGFSGDNGPATSAEQNSPKGVAMNSAGEVFIADFSNHRVRKISTSGVISTIAGTGTGGFSGDNGPATSAQLNFPTSVAVNSAGEVFITDSNNNRVRKVSTGGIISTIAGTGAIGFSGDNGPATSSKLFYPYSVAVNSAGEVFIADFSNHRVRKVSTGGIISTIAGTGTPGFSGDNIPATSAKIYNPTSVAVNSVGELFITDSNNNRIRKVSTSGIISTIAGTGISGFSGDNGPATSAQIFNPHSVAVNSIGEVFFADFNNRRIRKITTDGNIVTIAGNSNYGRIPIENMFVSSFTYVTALSDGGMLFSDTANHIVRRIHADNTVTTVAGNVLSGFAGDNGPATTARLNAPRGVAVNSAGEVFIADFSNHRVRKVSTDGIISTIAGTGISGFSGDNGPATSAQLFNPYSVAMNSVGEVFVADSNNHRIRKVSTSGVISTIAGIGVAGFVGDNGPATSARLNSPRGVVVNSAGEVFIADYNNHRIRKVSTDGIISTIAGTGIGGFSGDNGPATSAQLNYPTSVAVNSAGELFIADYNNRRIRKVTTDGNMITIAGTGASGSLTDGQLATTVSFLPYSVAVTSTGSVLVGDSSALVELVSGCSDGWFGQSCDIPQCHGILANETSVCNNQNGTCIRPDVCQCIDGYNGSECEIPMCFGVNSTSSDVCNYGNGTCVSKDNCKCNSGWTGDECEIAICNSIRADEARVCSNKQGDCILPEICKCMDGWTDSQCSTPTCNGTVQGSIDVCSGRGECVYAEVCRCTNSSWSGQYCEIPKCNGTLANETSFVCNGHGDCVNVDVCQCVTSSWGGQFCEIPKCNGTQRGDSNVCSSRGECIDANTCQCTDSSSWGGQFCEIPKCNGTLASDSSVCNGQGVCLDVDQCNCNSTHWGGQFCDIPKCNGTLATSEKVCEGKGVCVEPDVCQCSNSSIWGGRYCSIPKCNGTLQGEINVCNNRGDCIDVNVCVCSDASSWGGQFCDKSKCNGTLQDESNVCTGNGICVDVNTCVCNSTHWGGQFCDIPKCNGTLANETSIVCNGRGQCNAPDSCICNDDSLWTGSDCQVPKCYGKTQGQKDVCNNGKGECTSPNNCVCQDGYTGVECEIPICFGILSNDSSVCNYMNGTCDAPNNCSCSEGWVGEQCQVAVCFGINSTEPNVCSGKGSCTGPDTCLCVTNYNGKECHLTTCFGVQSDSVSVCYEHGQCIDYNTCNCTNGYAPSTTCQFPICFGKLANDSTVCNNLRGDCIAPDYCSPRDATCFGKAKNDTLNVCSGNGACIDWDVCSCKTGFYGDKCQDWKCYGKNHTDTNNVCSSNGKCQSLNNCVCTSGWFGNECNVPMCEGKLANSSDVCNYKNGTCAKPGPCSCFEGWTGNSCETPICFYIVAGSNACSGRGSCIRNNTCQCDASKYDGEKCQYYKCFGISSSDTNNVCSGNGTCEGVDLCNCKSGYGDAKCDAFFCNGTLSTNPSVCSGHGKCTGINSCSCDSGYFGNNCENTYCHGIQSTSDAVCSYKNGTCTAFNTCKCSQFYVGSNCEIPVCFQVPANDTNNVCSGRGVCTIPDQCTCHEPTKYGGFSCSQPLCFGILSTNTSSVCSGKGQCSSVDKCGCHAGFMGDQCQLVHVPATNLQLTFNSSKDYVNEASTLVKLTINQASFVQYYSNRQVRVKFDFEQNGQIISSLNKDISSGVTTLEFLIPAFSTNGTVRSFAVLSDVSTALIISDRVQSSSLLSIEKRPVVSNERKSNGSDQTVAIAVGITVPLVALGAIGAFSAVATAVVLLKKKASETSAAKQITEASHLDVELANGC
ncbi:hypothetical protein C9374_014632 [Naegleria lovaniensis]|uniref:EGF-like domain-containing protein n=1 Tax=Naegleria lovaniensis TaxID=51637 RepID=A0AA88KUJ3_NAELO|nr:uncharacterized protein C9374_014632 [Naegleria lovaniensis]KAG2389232.1 hypothetical protein C9374_014632 [Naegleria lovaniensis]